jgi:glutathione synthase/RimK-type ligase-like ATP-grasp enzyme
MNIAIASSIDNIGKISEDVLLRDTLQQLGANSEIIVWDDDSVNWDKYDAVVLRSVWDYYIKYDLFIKWLEILNSKGIPLINDTKIVRWNIQKDKQFSTLTDMGLPIIPYAISNSSDFNPEYFMDKWHTDALVIKPTVSASGYNTFIIGGNGIKNSIGKSEIANIFQNSQFIIQPFIKNITQGEYAVVFIDGQYSHTSIRFPGRFEEKKSAQYIEKDQVPESVMKIANMCAGNIQRHFKCAPVYARYDIVDGYVMEIELAEPDLMTRTIQDETERKTVIKNLAMAIIKRIS